MNGKEEFEKWARPAYNLEKRKDGNYKLNETRVTCAGFLARQPEIDALIHDNKRLYESLNSEASERCRLEDENKALKAEVETLRKVKAAHKAGMDRAIADAERYRYLRERDLDTIEQGGVFAGMTPDDVVLNGDDLDNAIDNALKEQK